MERLLEVAELNKSFGGRKILDRVSFVLHEGECTVLAGPNGSGKSTLLRIIAGLLKPDAGSVRLYGEHAGAEGRKAAGELKTALPSSSIGLVPDRMPFLRFTPEEYFRHMGAIRGMEQALVQEQMDRLLKVCRLDSARHAPIRHFSKGMLQKVGIIQALLDSPRLLLMDEPFSGLDVEAQEELVSLLQELSGRGMSLLFSSHEPELSGRLANRMLAFKDGLLLDESMEQRKIERMVIRVRGLVMERAVRIGEQCGGCPFTREEDEIWFFPNKEHSDSLLLLVLQAGGSVTGVQAEQEQRDRWAGRGLDEGLGRGLAGESGNGPANVLNGLADRKRRG